MGPRQEIGRGVRSIVYAFGDGEAVKVPNRDVPTSWIVEELRLTDVAARAGAPVPGARRLVDVEGTPSLVEQRVGGTSMWQRILADPVPEACAPLAFRLARVQYHLAGLPVSFELPSQRDRIVAKVHVAAERFGAEFHGVLDLLPDDVGPMALCHGDLHPRNVLLGPDGEVLVDWFDASRGAVVADVARTLVALDDTLEVSIDAGAAVGPAVEVFRERYLAAVSDLMGITSDDLAPWLLIQQVARLAEGLGRDRVDELRRRVD